jgi:hypothetical protein
MVQLEDSTNIISAVYVVEHVIGCSKILIEELVLKLLRDTIARCFLPMPYLNHPKKIFSQVSTVGQGPKEDREHPVHYNKDIFL